MQNDNTIPTAFQTIKDAMLREPDYAYSWHANIAMPIYDSCQEPMCRCPYSEDYGYKSGRHDEECPVVVYRHEIFDGKRVVIPIEQANEIASRLMNHLFGAQTSQDMLVEKAA